MGLLEAVRRNSARIARGEMLGKRTYLLCPRCFRAVQFLRHEGKTKCNHCHKRLFRKVDLEALKALLRIDPDGFKDAVQQVCRTAGKGEVYVHHSRWITFQLPTLVWNGAGWTPVSIHCPPNLGKQS
jgi:DNA-directed RNA polymerase subunit RPC12/RpoP